LEASKNLDTYKLNNVDIKIFKTQEDGIFKMGKTTLRNYRSKIYLSFLLKSNAIKCQYFFLKIIYYMILLNSTNNKKEIKQEIINKQKMII
jgi:hypothetical protein